MMLMPLVGAQYVGDLKTMMPAGAAAGRLDPHIPYIGEAMVEGNVATVERASAFLAQLAHESGEYRYMEELADGRAYEFRTDLGNTPADDGDGPFFKGHGPMQITGHDNHVACGLALGLDLVKNPRLLMLPENATRSAVWFWNSRNLSRLADKGWFKEITRRINGGYTGWEERVKYYNRNRVLLGLGPYRELNEINSIIDFQSSNGLVADGQVGPKTMAKLLAS